MNLPFGDSWLTASTAERCSSGWYSYTPVCLAYNMTGGAVEPEAPITDAERQHYLAWKAGSPVAMPPANLLAKLQREAAGGAIKPKPRMGKWLVPAVLGGGALLGLAWYMSSSSRPRARYRL